MIRNMLAGTFRRIKATVELPARVRALEAEKRQLQAEVARATEFALMDALTGLLNKRALDNALEEIRTEVRDNTRFHVRRAPRTPETYGFLAIDLVGFKRINDRFGHAVGDRALVAAAEAIRRSIRTTDRLVFRPGGDEFVVLLRDVNLEEARIVAIRIICNIHAIAEYELSARVGGVVWNTATHPMAPPRDVLNRADQLETALKQMGLDGQLDVQDYAP